MKTHVFWVYSILFRLLISCFCPQMIFSDRREWKCYAGYEFLLAMLSFQLTGESNPHARFPTDAHYASVSHVTTIITPLPISPPSFPSRRNAPNLIPFPLLTTTISPPPPGSGRLPHGTSGGRRWRGHPRLWRRGSDWPAMGRWALWRALSVGGLTRGGPPASPAARRVPADQFVAFFDLLFSQTFLSICLKFGL